MADEEQLFWLGLLVTSFICCVNNLWLKWVCNPRTPLQIPAAKGSGTKEDMQGTKAHPFSWQLRLSHNYLYTA